MRSCSNSCQRSSSSCFLAFLRPARLRSRETQLSQILTGPPFIGESGSLGSSSPLFFASPVEDRRGFVPLLRCEPSRAICSACCLFSGFSIELVQTSIAESSSVSGDGGVSLARNLALAIVSVGRCNFLICGGSGSSVNLSGICVSTRDLCPSGDTCNRICCRPISPGRTVAMFVVV
jgi:hypothetical protein